MLRLREFTQVEGQIFILEKDEYDWPQIEDVKDEILPLIPYESQQEGSEEVQFMKISDALKKGHFQKPAYAWCVYLTYKIFKKMGFNDSNMRLRQHLPTERAHYAADAWDVEIYTRSFGWVECCGVHDRGNYDLGRHQEFSKERMSVKVDKKPVVPEVLEIAFGVERPLFCQIDNSYVEDDERSWLKFPPEIAPIQVAVFPLMGKPELLGPAQEIYEDFLDGGLVTQIDISGSIGRRYRRQDEVGTPFCVTIDYQTLDDDTVTIRDRNSMEQRRIKRDVLFTTLRNLVYEKIKFTEL
jgi:glycyl-tRNA synthetase